MSFLACLLTRGLADFFTLVVPLGPSFSLKEGGILFSSSSPCPPTLGQLRRNSQFQLPPGLSSALGLGEENPSSFLWPLLLYPTSSGSSDPHHRGDVARGCDIADKQ